MPLELNDIVRFLQNKKILIAGFGREGKSSFAFLKKHLRPNQIFIADRNPELPKELPESFPASNLYSGNDYLKSGGNFDLILKTPGIPMSEFAHIENSEIISSQTELFLKFFRSRVIGITGTKGKSTTSSLIHHILKTNGIDSILAGNIGAPIFDYLDTHNGTYVLELSSHQLQNCRYSPHISVLLNIFPEHLDHYKSFEEYAEAKWQIALHQNAEDLLILPQSLYECASEKHSLKANIQGFDTQRLNQNEISGIGFGLDSIFYKSNSGENIIKCNCSRIKLRGIHNRLNMGAAFLATSACGLSNEQIMEAMYSFEPLPHRLEYVGRFKDIDFYNDSIATIPEACIAALSSVPECDSIILGGFNRGIDYESLIQFLISNNVSNLIFLGEVGQILKNILRKYNHHKKVFDAYNIKMAVEMAYKHTKKGHACLLSPAASSYDQFKNFEDRGDQFKAAVKFIGTLKNADIAD